MTTESTQAPRGARAPGGLDVLVGTAVVAVLLGLVLTLVGALAGGPAAAFAALAGTLLVVGVLAFGSITVNAVAGVLPSASLVVALLTYTLQLMLLGLALVWLDGSGLLEGTLDRRWLAAGVIVGTLVWQGAQVMLTSRARIPVYDLPDGSEAGARR